MKRLTLVVCVALVGSAGGAPVTAAGAVPAAHQAFIPAPTPKKGDYALLFYRFKLRSERVVRLLTVWRGGVVTVRRLVGELPSLPYISPDGFACLTRNDRLRVRRVIMRTLPLPAMGVARPYTAGAEEIIAADPRAEQREVRTSPEAVAPLPRQMRDVARLALELRDAHRKDFYPGIGEEDPGVICNRERRKRARLRRERRGESSGEVRR